MEERLQAHFTAWFYKPLALVFDPINHFLGSIPFWMANWFGIGLFVAAMFWVAVILKEEYVNRGRPYESIFTDLRLWTVVCMLPHCAMYFYFK